MKKFMSLNPVLCLSFFNLKLLNLHLVKDSLKHLLSLFDMTIVCLIVICQHVPGSSVTILTLKSAIYPRSPGSF